MAEAIMAIIAFSVLVVVRRKEILEVRWMPSRDTTVALGLALVVAALSAVLIPLGPDSVAGRVVHYGLMYCGCGVAVPFIYAFLVEGSGFESLGLRKRKLRCSLAIGLAVSLALTPILVFQGGILSAPLGIVLRASVPLVLAGGLFELFLYYGFVHLRLRKAFGMIPAVILSSLLYVAWHTGTQLPYESDPVAAIRKLFFVGLMYQSLFALTDNLLVIWPFFHAVGVLIDFSVNLDELPAIAEKAGVAGLSVAGMCAAAAAVVAIARRPHRGLA